MAAAHGSIATDLTAIPLLCQRQHEDWIRVWDGQGNLRSDLTAQSIATAALQLRDWLGQQDWGWCDGDRCLDGDRAQAYTNHHAKLALAIQQQSIQTSTAGQQDRSDHLIPQPIVLLAISDPAQFLIWFGAVSNLGYPLFLGNPAWGLDHWQQVQEGLTPHLIVTDPDWAIPPEFPWRNWAVDNSPYLWEKQEYPQMFQICGKRIDPNDRKGLSPFRPRMRFPQAVESQWIGIPTGGSSGQLRFALHRWSTLAASVSGLQRSELTDSTGVVNSFCMLPLHHVSGLMQFLRSLLSGGQFWLLPWSAVKAKFQCREPSSIGNKTDTASPNPPFSGDLDQFFLSLVPTQLQHLMAQPNGRNFVVRFYTVFLGGAPAWPALLDQAKSAGIRLAPTYGMTETASQVITLHPDDFLRGQLGCGKLLPHAQIDWLSSPVQNNNNLRIPRQFKEIGDASGILRIRSHSLAWGYYSIQPLEKKQTNNPPTRYGGSLELWVGQDGLGEAARSLVTDDLGYCDPDGYFYIIGRVSDKIISGGENVFPAAVEAAIRATGLVKDTVVLGLVDAQWGERVVAVVVPEDAKANQAEEATGPVAHRSQRKLPQEWPSPGLEQWTEQLSGAIRLTLTPAQRPKQWLVTDAIPRNAQGKIQRQQLRDWAMEQGK